MLTRFVKPVGTTMTFRPLASVVSVARNGNTSLGAADCADTIAVNAAAAKIAANHRRIVCPSLDYPITRLLNYPILRSRDHPYGRLCRHAAQAAIGAGHCPRFAVPDVPHHVREPSEPRHGWRRHPPRPAPVEQPTRPD